LADMTTGLAPLLRAGPVFFSAVLSRALV
jgi:hypothetical protein